MIQFFRHFAEQKGYEGEDRLGKIPLKICNTCGRTYVNPDDFYRNTSRWRVCDSGHLWFNCTCNSTCMILQGAHDWFDPTLQMSSEAKTLFHDIPSLRSLPRIPSQVMTLQSMCDDPNVDAAQLAQAVKMDPLLATQVFNTVHQQVKTQKVESLAHAISLLGIGPIKDLVLIAGLGTLQLKTKVFRAEAFWEHSFLVGRCTEFLAKHFRQPLTPDQAYIAGCVCNVGKIVLAACMPELADQYVKEVEAAEGGCPWTEAEERHKGYQHTVLGEIGAVVWGLPAPVNNIIAYHHRIASRSPLEPLRTYELVGLANQLSHKILKQLGRVDQKLYQDLLQRFSLTEGQAEALVEQMASKV